jgi:hypothetical protein
MHTNSTKQTHIVKHKCSNKTTIDYTTPVNKSVRSRLTITSSDGTSVKLNGREINALRKVLDTGTSMRRISRRKLKTSNKRTSTKPSNKMKTTARKTTARKTTARKTTARKTA